MKTSSKARYSLHLIIDIAQHQDSGPVPLREVATRQCISLKYLEQLAKALTRDGYLKSVRGAQGGYLLARPATGISAGDVMRSAEGGFLSIACIDADAESCPRQSLCGVSRFWAGLRGTIEDYVDNVTVAELAAKEHVGAHGARGARGTREVHEAHDTCGVHGTRGAHDGCKAHGTPAQDCAQDFALPHLP
ncbi:MAG: Rrf2 family transcriptional regulator [Coriobacteriales bacterium]|jgi:Rrf2 family protein|nr:Rrf2 family transcriptional regulator [Coriobacteriales bacterium]